MMKTPLVFALDVIFGFANQQKTHLQTQQEGQI